jgi:hypothetical protein
VKKLVLLDSQFEAPPAHIEPAAEEVDGGIGIPVFGTGHRLLSDAEALSKHSLCEARTFTRFSEQEAWNVDLP